MCAFFSLFFEATRIVYAFVCISVNMKILSACAFMRKIIMFFVFLVYVNIISSPGFIRKASIIMFVCFVTWVIGWSGLLLKLSEGWYCHNWLLAIQIQLKQTDFVLKNLSRWTLWY